MRILIKGGRVLDPIHNLDKICDCYVEDGKIMQIANHIDKAAGQADKIIEAENMWVCPGLIDIHTHLRQPGFEYKEEIETGAKSAAKGGFTTICAMPNTKPATDSPEVVKLILDIAKQKAIVDVLSIGSTTKGQKGENVTDIEALVKAGVCAISEDGYTVKNARLIKDALIACAKYNVPMFSHCEDTALADGGVMNEGETAEKLGLPGISRDSEEVIVIRDMIIADSVKARLHLCHISTKGSCSLIRDVKARGFAITAEVCPHHFTLSDEDITSDDGKYKMHPPLRGVEDVAAMKAALKDNTIEVIATDHAPHHADEKTGGFMKAANGIVGLETAIPLCITELVHTGVLTPLELIRKLTCNPAKVIGSDKGTLSIGRPADITIIDHTTEYEINVKGFQSKSKNSPFDGRKVFGKAAWVIKDGAIIVENGELAAN